MSRHRQLLSRLRRRHLIISLLFTLVACSASIYLFGLSGPFYQSLNIDLTFLILPFCGYYTLRLFSRLTGAFVRSFKGKMAAILLNGAAFIFFCYFFFSRALLFTRIPALSNAANFLNDVSNLTVSTILFFVGLIIFEIAELLRFTKFERTAAPACGAAGLTIMGCGVWLSCAVFSPSWPPATRVGLVFFGAVLALAISPLGIYLQDSNNPLLADTAKWIKDRPFSNFFTGGLIAAYLIFIRPAIFSVFPYAFLIEWFIFCFAAWRIFSGIRNGLQKQYATPIREAGWQRHEQKVNELKDDDFIKLSVLQKDYVEIGTRQDLLEYLNKILLKNGLSEDEIGRTLSPIIEYNEIKTPWYTFGIWKKRTIKQNRRNRLTSLNHTMTRLNTLAYPSRR